MHICFVYISGCKYLTAICVEMCGQPRTMWVPGIKLRFAKLGSKCLYLLSHLTCHKNKIFKNGNKQTNNKQICLKIRSDSQMCPSI